MNFALQSDCHANVRRRGDRGWLGGWRLGPHLSYHRRGFQRVLDSSDHLRAVNRLDFLSINRETDLKAIIKTKLVDLGNKDTKKILIIKINPPTSRRSETLLFMETVGEVVQQELARIGVRDRVGFFVFQDNVDMQILDLEDGNDKEQLPQKA